LLGNNIPKPEKWVIEEARPIICPLILRCAPRRISHKSTYPLNPLNFKRNKLNPLISKMIIGILNYLIYIIY